MNLIQDYLDQQMLTQQCTDKTLLYWLTQIKAFTPELRKYSADISLKLISQEEETLYPDECDALEASHQRSKGLVRAVLIFAREQVMCFARVCISDKTLKNQPEDIDSLASKPIGETLFFNDGSATRDRFAFFNLDHEQTFKQCIPLEFQPEFETYGRRSIFKNNSGEVLVTEIFSKHLRDISRNNHLSLD